MERKSHMKSTINVTDHPALPAARRHACDEIITGAARIIIHEVGVTVPQMVDRMLTFAAAQSCATDGRSAASAAFRAIADQIDNGIFAAVEPKGLVQ
ncbi:hypothetical protein [Agrobacterium tumefaciens]|uniref:Uncharacterized protein n=1 Tax=Agrobacterium tumefaciens TaxID=358 RepID=A0AA44F2W1_AGRTU|nr:hypothetical protein [Agrobacterium tumefaciens]NSL22882.1 hypothetical protein [Agrobacterium tumefaciens]NTB84110.1 hypothetical protein [Agrobacterium tumefaciens]NTC20211.1 hypothetical protein [Agrobacterium tumefaciens]NTC27398.1 hypothetical protein [Agrobacterium tumefaciens]NTC56731.1 hypothetical protein [Agrobacterium tumefaciens]